MTVLVPDTGEWFVQNGKVRRISESEMTDYIENDVGYLIWVSREGEDE
jgi:hypothetical protein